jgi:hypothetical protein
MLDAGVYITAFLCPKSAEGAAIIKASEGLHRIVVSDSVRDEVYAFFSEFIPEKLVAAEEFFADLTVVEVTAPNVLPATAFPRSQFSLIPNEPRDLPAGASLHEVFVTSDPELLESVIDYPKMMTAAEFLRYK